MPVQSYVNGRYVRHHGAAIHIEDRGYQFADGVYEVIAVYGGGIVDEGPHLERLFRSLGELNIAAPGSERSIKVILREVLFRNRVRDGALYLQVSRGVAVRNHAHPPDMKPAFVVTARAHPWPKDFAAVEGIAVIAIADQRWSRCDIKTVSLLPNVLARMGADTAGADDAWMIGEDGLVTEGTASNAWIVTDAGEIVTRQLSQAILAGVTRRTILEFAAARGMTITERAFTLSEAKAAREAFQTSTTALVKPVLKIDAAVIGGGAPGPVTEVVFTAYLEHFASFGGAA
ncbi:MAG: D-amino-acid transaminase [Rhodospirillales bacterium]|jgi:D-alanine transaminase|nr:D-amino-acid transaminase [Rhodospirillales bacterium]MDP6644099.1 D-amino-acid transaminase [Rhodospirillales bacterium]MDP6841151.1 D-amino-acid transaminase [Rhodospirillales bacterium]|tara:strand:+ start:1482 stop:2345 length:864 start_codon:yes stop_codon:yes gene_type:complete